MPKGSTFNQNYLGRKEKLIMKQDEFEKEDINNNKTSIEEKKEYFKFSEIEERETEWIWYPYIPKGMVTILQGDPKCGKTTLLSDIIARITNGDKKPFSDECFEMGNVIFQNDDDPAYILGKRLAKQNANLDRVMIVDESNKELYFKDLTRLEDTIKKENPCMVVFDPVQSFLGDANQNSQVEVRNALMPLKALSEKYNCAIVLVQHLKKGSETKAIYKGVGSIDFVGFARSTIMVVKDPLDKTERMMLHTSSNVAKEGHCLTYKISDYGLVWVADKGTMDADDVISEVANTKQEYAKYFILGCLSSVKELKATEWDKLIKISGLQKHTFDNARRLLSSDNVIHSERKKDGVYWHLSLDKCNMQSCKEGLNDND